MESKMQLWLTFLRILSLLAILNLAAWLLFPGYVLGLLILLGIVDE